MAKRKPMRQQQLRTADPWQDLVDDLRYNSPGGAADALRDQRAFLMDRAQAQARSVMDVLSGRK